MASVDLISEVEAAERAFYAVGMTAEELDAAEAAFEINVNYPEFIGLSLSCSGEAHGRGGFLCFGNVLWDGSLLCSTPDAAWFWR